MNSLILDLSVTAILVIFVASGFQKGAFRSFWGFACSIFVSIMSIFVAGKASEYVYGNFISGYLEKTIKSTVVASGLNTYKILDKIPNGIANFLISQKITPEVLNHIMDSNTSATIPERISAVLKPGIVSILKSCFILCALAVLSSVMRFFSKYVFKLFRSSLFKGTSSILGGVFGFLKGYVVIAVCMCCIKSALPFWINVPEIFSESSVSESVVFKKLYNHNPVYEFLSNIN